MTTEEAIKYLIKPVATSTEIGEEKQKEFEAYNMAIEALRNEINCVKCVYYTERETYTGIKGVCKMDTAHREDLIRRQDAIDAMWKSLYAYEDLTEKQFMEHEELELEDWFKHRIFVQRMHEECMKAVEALPSVERPKGEWKEIAVRVDGYGAIYYQHDCCCEIYKCPYNFCPNCGAKMKGADDD